MSDANNAPASKAVSKRIVLATDGSEAGWTDAAAITYTATKEGYQAAIIFDGSFDEAKVGDADKILNLSNFAGDEKQRAALFGLAAFGALTYLGNITNPVRNPTDKAKPLANADGSLVTEADRLALALDNLANGEWTNQRGEGEGSTALVVEALARIKGYDMAEAAAKWREKSDEERAALKKVPLVTKTIQQIRLERLEKAAQEQKPEHVDF